jgi:surface polysaccharide O-acyltransferase-like enzyme
MLTVEKSVKERNLAIDLLKATSILGVLIVHSSVGGYSYPIGSPNWLTSLFLAGMSRACVPVFLMCSGALLLDPEKELSLKTLYAKYIPRILAALFFWAMAYKFYDLLIRRDISAEAVIRALKEVLLFKHENHFYYLHIVLLVYAFLPVARLFVKYADKRLEEYALLLWFVLGIVYPTLRPCWPFTLLSGIPLQWLMNMTYASLGYALLGHYMLKYPLNRKFVYLLAAAAGFATVFFGTWLTSARQNGFNEHFYEGMSVGVALLAFGSFGFCTARLGRSVPAKIAPLVTFGSKASFCIYLVHIFFLKAFASLGFTVRILPCVVSIPLLVAANIACSVCVYLLLSRIPPVKKWLI